LNCILWSDTENFIVILELLLGKIKKWLSHCRRDKNKWRICDLLHSWRYYSNFRASNGWAV